MRGATITSSTRCRRAIITRLYGVFASTTFPVRRLGRVVSRRSSAGRAFAPLVPAGGGRSAAGRVSAARLTPTAPRNRSSLQTGNATIGARGKTAQIAAAAARSTSNAREPDGAAGGLRRQRRDGRPTRTFNSMASPASPGREFRAALPASCPDVEAPAPGPQRERPAGAGRLARVAAKSAHRAGDGQSRLAASFRPGHRGHAVELRHAGQPARRIPNCSTGSPRRSSSTAGRSSRLHRLIMNCRRRTSSRPTRDAADDGSRFESNRWYWRFNRQRLDAEAIRDAMLDVSRHARSFAAGAASFPRFAIGTGRSTSPFKAAYPSDHRSVYLMTQRQFIGIRFWACSTDPIRIRPPTCVPPRPCRCRPCF